VISYWTGDRRIISSCSAKVTNAECYGTVCDLAVLYKVPSRRPRPPLTRLTSSTETSTFFYRCFRRSVVHDPYADEVHQRYDFSFPSSSAQGSLPRRPPRDVWSLLVGAGFQRSFSLLLFNKIHSVFQILITSFNVNISHFFDSIRQRSSPWPLVFMAALFSKDPQYLPLYVQNEPCSTIEYLLNAPIESLSKIVDWMLVF